MIIDFHTHAFPDHLVGSAMSQISGDGEIPCYSDGSVAGLKESMRNAGITHSVLCNIAVKPGKTDKITAFAAQVLEAGGGGELPCVVPFASVHPFDPDWRQWLNRFHAMGFRGIKLHPDYQGFFVDDPRLEPFYREAARLGLTVVIHAGFDDMFPDLTHATPERLAEVLPLLEQCNAVLAHMGGYLMWEGVLKLLCGSNVYLDTSLYFDRMDRELAREIFRRHTPDRILFGSDSPWSCQATQLEYLRGPFAEGFLSPADVERVLWHNGAALLGLDSEKRAPVTTPAQQLRC